MAQSGDKDQAEVLLEEAQEAARSITNYWQRAKALSELAGALAQAEDNDRAEALFEEAQETAGYFDISGWRSYHGLIALASTFAQAERFSRALALLGLLDANRVSGYRELAIDVFMRALTELALSFERSGLSLDVVRETASIAGWVHPGWSQIHDLIPKSERYT